MKKYKIKKNKGFTLIELLVVIAIIGLLASIILASLNIARARARDAQRQSDVHQVQVALDLYALDHNGLYPTGGSFALSPSKEDQVAESKSEAIISKILAVFTPVAHASSHLNPLCNNADILANALVPNYISRMPTEPLDTPSGDTCYRYEPDPNGAYAAFFTTLETQTYAANGAVHKKIGIIAGQSTTANQQLSCGYTILKACAAGGSAANCGNVYPAFSPYNGSCNGPYAVDTILGTNTY